MQKVKLVGMMISLCALSVVSCSKNNDKVKEEVISDKYEMVKVQFSPQEQNNFIAIDSKAWTTEYSNSGDVKASFRYKSELNPVDTCVFHTPAEVLPKGCKLQDLMTETPAIDCTPRFVGIESYYKMNFEEKQTKSKKQEWAQQVANVAPHSAVTIAHWMKGYKLKADYSVTLRNTKTGSLYYLHGKWEGTQFVEDFTKLTEKKLN
jgi:hypothetical protein